MVILIALSLAAPPALPPQASPRARQATERVRSHARASVRIVRPYRLEVGKAHAAPGASRRKTQITGPGGARLDAILVEFE
ncbi:hypothetical protein [Sphingomicrobium flavum]|uniref:hypothetical protein n=1 Tax=Sphingomicrobium flavum TaxID=1229164 RepID=UPI0021ADF55D|nr:hypothetical protein [Sphingomicrobium flavum]